MDIHTLRSIVKDLLKSRGIKYQNIAQKLSISAPSVSKALREGSDYGGKTLCRLYEDLTGSTVERRVIYETEQI